VTCKLRTAWSSLRTGIRKFFALVLEFSCFFGYLATKNQFMRPINYKLHLEGRGDRRKWLKLKYHSGAHPASYPMGGRDSFQGDKAAVAWSWPLTSIWSRGQECVELYLHFPIRPNGMVLSWSTGTALETAEWLLVSQRHCSMELVS